MARIRTTSGWIGLAMCLALVSGCEPVDPALEAALLPEGTRTGQGGASGSAIAVSPRRARASANPEFDPKDRIVNTNPRVLTNNVYGPGRSSDVYGRVVYHNPGLIIDETAQGTGDYQDQYGRPVRCYGAGGGKVCR